MGVIPSKTCGIAQHSECEVCEAHHERPPPAGERRDAAAEDLGLITYFAFGADALFESIASQIRLGEVTNTLEAYADMRTTWEQTGKLDTPAGAVLLMDIGIVKWLQGDTASALEEYMRALEIRRSTHTVETPDGAALLRSAGIARSASGDLAGAEEAYAKALQIRERTGTVDTPDGAMLYTCIGLAKWSANDCEGAIEAYTEARMIRQRIGALATVDGMRLLTNVGATQLDCGREEDALLTFGEALAIRRDAGELQCLDGAWLWVNIGAAECTCGHPAEALASYTEARRILEAIKAYETINGASLMMNVGIAERLHGNLGGAIGAYQEVVRIREALGELSEPAGARVLLSLAFAELDRGNLDAAWEAFLRAKTCGEAVALEAPWATELLREVAVAKEKGGDLEQALEVYGQEEEVRKRAGSLETVQGQILVTMMEAIKAHLQASTSQRTVDEPEAEEGPLGSPWEDPPSPRGDPCAGSEACGEQHGSPWTASDALLLAGLGHAKKDMGDVEGAVQVYMEAYQIRAELGILGTAEGVRLLRHLGAARRAAGDPEGALEAFQHALGLCRGAAAAQGSPEPAAEGGVSLETADGASLLACSGAVRHALADVPGALADWAEARRVMELLGSMDSAEGVHLMSCISAAKQELGECKEALAALEEAHRLRVRLGALEAAEGGEAEEAPGLPGDDGKPARDGNRACPLLPLERLCSPAVGKALCAKGPAALASECCCVGLLPEACRQGGAGRCEVSQDCLWRSCEGALAVSSRASARTRRSPGRHVHL